MFSQNTRAPISQISDTRNRRYGAALAAVTSLFIAHPSLAQNEAVLDPISVTATEVAPGGVQVNSEQIDHANPTDISEVFQGESAVNVGGGSDVSRKSYVNGIEDTNLNVKIDGARQVNSAFHHLGTAIIDPGLLKSVRIETGVGPADVGPGSLGGSIAYETKDARDIVAADEIFGGYLKSSYDSNSATKRGIFTFATRKDNFEGLFHGTYENGNSYEDGDNKEVVGTAPKMKNFIGKLGWTGTSGGRVEVNSGYTQDIGIRPNRSNFGSLVNGSPPTEHAYKRKTLSVSYKDEAPTETVNPELVLSVNQSSLSIDRLAFGPNRFHLGSTTTSYSGKAANTFATNLGPVGSGNVTAGMDFYRDRGEGDLSGGFAGAGVPLQNEETSLNVGGFVQARLKLTKSFRVSVGGRYDQQWFEGIDGTEITAGGPSANANAEYDVVSGITGYAGVGSTYGQIPLGESAIYNFASRWNYDGLTSSRSWNYKLGAKVDNGPFSADAHLFLNKIFGSHERGNARRSTSRDLDSRGFNLAGKYDYGAGFIRSTFTHSKFRANGELLVSGSGSFHGLQMGDILTVDGAHTFMDTGLRLGASAEYAFRDEDNSAAHRPAYFVAGIYGQWTPPGYRFVRLRLDVKNLLDTTYVDRATSADTDNTQANAFKEQGRTFLLTANVTF
tara:strand:+ start:8943 stop:10955 length:2013 start_codon:yes stop_codon:yes gene_type:complete